MELIDQHTKNIMEGCKERARNEGLRFHDETLEYIVTNRDLLELSPKLMIPTLYDYWVHDVDLLKEKGRYELYPANPYETVINTRPAISFYNDNNPDWLNVMIFYHVLAHIDFFQNNLFFRRTWDDDFAGQALADKRLIAKLRSEKGRWIDYVIEFTRGIDNLVGFFVNISASDHPQKTKSSKRLDFYFDIFLQDRKNVSLNEYMKEIERYNRCVQLNKTMGEETFFFDIAKKYPEFEAQFTKKSKEKPSQRIDLVDYIMDHSDFLNRAENKWMKSVMLVVRNTSLFFQPQIRTKIINEGWASYWHETLFLRDNRINGHEVDFARVHAGVTALPKIGLNPYALGMQLFQYIKDSANRGKYSFDYIRLTDTRSRDQYNTKTGLGKSFMFKVRESYCDFTFLNSFVDQEFVRQNKLYVTGRRLNQQRMTWEYYIKSRNAEDYRQMLFDSLYHPPHIEIDTDKNRDGSIYLVHRFERKPLVKEFIANTMMGVEYLWGGPVQLETSEVIPSARSDADMTISLSNKETEDAQLQRVLYTMKGRKLSKRII